MKKAFALIATIFLFASAQGQQVLNLLTGELRDGSDATSPSCSILTLDDGYQVPWEFTEARLVEDREFENTVLWFIPGFRQSDKAGEPCISCQYDWLQIGDSTPTLEVVESSFVDYNYQLAPAFPAQPGDPLTYDRVERIPIKSYEGYFPTHVVEEAGYFPYYGGREVGYAIYPIQYNFEQQIVRAYTKIVYKVTLSDSTTGIEELKTKEDMSTVGFTLDGRPAKGNAKSVIVRDGRKVIVK